MAISDAGVCNKGRDMRDVRSRILSFWGYARTLLGDIASKTTVLDQFLRSLILEYGVERSAFERFFLSDSLRRSNAFFCAIRMEIKKGLYWGKKTLSFLSIAQHFNKGMNHIRARRIELQRDLGDTCTRSAAMDKDKGFFLMGHLISKLQGLMTIDLYDCMRRTGKTADLLGRTGEVVLGLTEEWVVGLARIYFGIAGKDTSELKIEKDCFCLNHYCTYRTYLVLHEYHEICRFVKHSLEDGIAGCISRFYGIEWRSGVNGFRNIHSVTYFDKQGFLASEGTCLGILRHSKKVDFTDCAGTTSIGLSLGKGYFSSNVLDGLKALILFKQSRANRNGTERYRYFKFMDGLGRFNDHLARVYKDLSFGGCAEVDMVDGCDPFKKGLFFVVRPPCKSWRKVRQLSGGERTVASLALIFARYEFRRNPLYVMDEVDAALDSKNSIVLGKYISLRILESQILSISLRIELFSFAERFFIAYRLAGHTRTVICNYKELIV